MSPTPSERMKDLLGEMLGCIVLSSLYFILYLCKFPPILNIEDVTTQELGWGHPFAVLSARRQYDYEEELYGKAESHD